MDISKNHIQPFTEHIKDYMENLAPQILEPLGFGVVLIDKDTHEIVYTNSKILSMGGYCHENVIGKPCYEILCPTVKGQCPVINNGLQIDNMEGKMTLSDGRVLSVIKTAVPILLNGKGYFVESIIDNTQNQVLKLENAKACSKIQHLAYHDYLTGLPNRMLFTEKLNRAIEEAESTKKLLAIMFLDLDCFKMVNDAMGHAAGDKLLAEVSGRLLKSLGKNASIARIGGDEFIILIENISDADEVTETADKILKCFDEHFIIEGEDFFVTASMGISVYPNDGCDAEVLIKNADIAMYKAKEKGRSQYVLCTFIMKKDVEETMILTNHLHRALEKGELELYYQPQVNCCTNEIIGVEALLRWEHPNMGLISPGKFIPIAEQTGLIISIGEWVIREACMQNKAWQDAGLPHIKVAVNLSVRQFQNQNIIKQVSDILIETQMESKYLELEITESIAMKETGYVIEILSAFKKMGIDISIDDFGTEYSCLKYLKQLPVDRIKIAMPFIQGIDVSDKDEAIAKAIIVLAKSMKLRVIAEGVETERQLSFLSGNMCDEVQGYYYYKPMPAKKIEELLKNRH